jgi:small subunit ribosomal protein S7
MTVLAPARFFRLASRPARFRRNALPILQRRHITSDGKPLPEKDSPGKGPNQDQLSHVSEEAAETAKIMGEKGPEFEQGTPIQEVSSDMSRA